MPSVSRLIAPAKPVAAPAATDTASSSSSSSTTPPAMGQPPAKKRKVADAASPRPKKSANPTSWTAAAPTSTKSRKSRKAKAPDSPPPATPTPTRPALSPGLVIKIRQVHKFLNDAHCTLLDSKSKDSHIVIVPKRDLIGVISTMRLHWELGNVDDAIVEEIQEAMTGRELLQPVGTSAEKYQWVTLDLKAETEIEKNIKEKVAMCGLDDVSLLGVELVLFRRAAAMSFEVVEDSPGCRCWEYRQARTAGDGRVEVGSEADGATRAQQDTEDDLAAEGGSREVITRKAGDSEESMVGESKDGKESTNRAAMAGEATTAGIEHQAGAVFNGIDLAKEVKPEVETNRGEPSSTIRRRVACEQYE